MIHLQYTKKSEIEFFYEENNVRIISNFGDEIEVIWKIKDNVFHVGYHTYKICAFGPIVKKTVELLICEYEIQRKKTKSGKFIKEAPIREWFTKKISRKFGKKFHAAWLYLRDKIDPEIIEIDKKLFSAFARPEPNKYLNKILENKFEKKDVLNIRAAACAWEVLSQYQSGEIRSPCNTWREFYGQPTTSLNKTLAKLPGGIPQHLLLNINHITLTRPIYRRSELILNCITWARMDWNFFKLATHKEIKKALEILGKHQRTKYSIRKWQHIQALYLFCSEYPEPFNGKLVGLLEKSIKWHRENYYNRAKKYTGNIPLDTLTGKPLKIELPKDDRIRFLDTAGSLVEEGSLMQHCIANYIKSAIKGEYFHFHVEYKEEMASVQLDRNLRIVQNYGPRNTKNRAVDFAAKYFAGWRKNIPNIEVHDTIQKYVTIPF